MSRLTTDRSDPGLGVPGPDGQNRAYLVLSEEERARGFVRPVRTSYVHQACGHTTSMSVALAETFARQPTFYGRIMCVACRGNFPVGSDGEFTWVDTDEKVGT